MMMGVWGSGVQRRVRNVVDFIEIRLDNGRPGSNKEIKSTYDKYLETRPDHLWSLYLSLPMFMV